MKKASIILSAIFLIGLLASAASAVTIGYDYMLDDDGISTTTRSGAYVWDFNDPDDPFGNRPGIFADILHNDAAVVTGSVSGKYAAPYIADTGLRDHTPYLTVPGPNSNGTGSFKVALASTADYFGLLWGSMDTYNTLTFWHQGSVVGSFTGSDVADPTATGNQGVAGQNRYVNFSDFLFDEFELHSNGFAFEVDNIAVAPVPEPGTIFLMGLGVAGLVAWRKKFRK
jgi:hypothetical protein